jgi:hypothetical protein|uniref:Uncharacterized protein n=1 Tax=viral metagenome TaxID=1070528 RepID=A0A6C0IPT4_9ZZZZ
MYYYLALAVIGYFGYNKYKKNVDTVLINGTFKILKLYHIMNDYMGFKDEEISEGDLEIKEINKPTYLYIKDGKDHKMNESDSPKWNEIDFIILKMGDVSKILEPILDVKKVMNDEIIKQDKKIFLQVIFKSKGETIDINHNLKTFFVVDNHILGYNFLKWFLYQYHKYELKDEDYVINIMDQNVMMFDLLPDKQIHLKDDNKYEII